MKRSGERGEGRGMMLEAMWRVGTRSAEASLQERDRNGRGRGVERDRRSGQG